MVIKETDVNKDHKKGYYNISTWTEQMSIKELGCHYSVIN